MKISDKIRQRLEEKRFYSNDNIAEYIEDRRT